MNRKTWAFLRRALGDQNAQVLPMMAVLMTMFFGMGAMGIDVADVYIAYNQLQAATQAAALAGAAAISIPSLGSPTTVAEQYGAESGEYSGVTVANSHPILLSPTMTPPVPQCITALTEAPYSVPCVTYTGESGTTGANAIQVVQTAKVRTYFAAFFGHPTVTLTASASALRSGAPAIPSNIAIILDTTASMSSSDDNCPSGTTTTGHKTTTTYYTRLGCAMQGVQTLLESMAPCFSDESTCGTATNGLTATSVDRVALFTFPNLYATAANVADDYNCGGTNPTIQPYSFPSSSLSSSSTYSSTLVPPTGLNATYAITYGLGDADGNGFVNDYKTTDVTQTLNSASDAVITLGGGACSGAQNPGGAGTYYAGAIYAATAALAAEQAANPGSQNVIILISDGDATSSGTSTYNCAQGTTGCTGSNCTGKGTTETCKTYTATANEMGSAASQTTYPGTKDECGQAITAANYAVTSGIVSRVYAVAYGAETTGCTTDGKATYTYQGSTTSAGTSSTFTPTPCTTMEDIASSTNYFFSDYTQGGAQNDTSCIGENKSDTVLNDIFTDIAADFLRARLIPNSAF